MPPTPRRCCRAWPPRPSAMACRWWAATPTSARASGQLAVAILGRANRLLTSFDARPGDALVMAIDLRGEFMEPHPFWNASTSAPAARLRADLALLPELAESGLCDAAKDISMAGAVGTALMLLEGSGVGGEIDVAAVPRPEGVPLSRWLQAFPSFGFVLAVRPDRTGCRAGPLRFTRHRRGRGRPGRRGQPPVAAPGRRAHPALGPRRAPLHRRGCGVKIGLLTHSVNPRGGVVHTLELAAALHAAGHDVTVFAPAAPGQTMFRPVAHAFARWCPWPSTPKDLHEMVGARIQAFEQHLGARQDLRRFDVWHAHDGIGGNALANLCDAGRIEGFVRTVHHLDTSTMRG